MIDIYLQKLKNEFTIEEMRKIVEYVDAHPNQKLSSIQSKVSRKVKYMYYITRMREYLEKEGTQRQQMTEINEFVLRFNICNFNPQ